MERLGVGVRAFACSAWIAGGGVSEAAEVSTSRSPSTMKIVESLAMLARSSGSR
ncbi:MAG: hypothetical protein M5T61_19035 [Acidimicrobiia bacterium]|nr:hypothetical protein [Acidimicrobiia bacterium]